VRNCENSRNFFLLVFHLIILSSLQFLISSFFFIPLNISYFIIIITALFRQSVLLHFVPALPDNLTPHFWMRFLFCPILSVIFIQSFLVLFSLYLPSFLHSVFSEGQSRNFIASFNIIFFFLFYWLLLKFSGGYALYLFVLYKVVQIWPGQSVTCLHTNSPGHIWTTLYKISTVVLS
jgi:hypothetical protein